jgi:hypothetical protein
MAIKHLANISLEGNEIQNVLIHKLAVEPSGVEGQVYFNTATNLLKVHNGSSWISVMGDVESIASGNASTITIGGTALNPTISANTAAVTNGSANLVTGDQVYDFVTSEIASLPAGADTTYDISVTDGSNQASIDLNAGGSGSGTDSVNIVGTTNEVTVEGSGSNITIGLPNDVTIAGNLTVNGTTTSINTNEVNIGDNIIVLNSDETGTPSQDGGIEIERGTSSNAKLFWDESADRWTMNNGSTDTVIPLVEITNNNQLTNGQGFITGLTWAGLTGSQSGINLSGFNNNMNVSDFTNDAGYITSASLIAARTDEEIRDVAAAQWTNGTNSTVVFDDASNTIKVNTVNTTYTNVSEFTNDAGYVTSSGNTTVGTDSDYSQSGINIIKSLTLTDGVITAFTDGNMQSALTTRSGVVELATNTETATGTDTARAVTPAGLASVLGEQNSTSNRNTFLIGNGSSTTITTAHGMSTKNLIVMLVEESSGDQVFAEISVDATNITTSFADAPSSNQYRLNVIKVA